MIIHLFLPQKIVVKRAVAVSFHIALPLAIKQVVKIASYQSFYTLNLHHFIWLLSQVLSMATHSQL